MASWVVTIDADHVQHWSIAESHGFWDMPKFQKVAFGDLVYFWQAGGSLIAQCLVTQGAYPIPPQHPTPWEDSGSRSYVARFHFDVLSEAPASQPRWGLLQEAMIKKMSPQLFPRFDSDQDQARLAEFFQASPDVEVSYEDLRSEGLEDMDDDRRGIDLRAIRTRQGQQGFRNKLISIYEGCAVSGTSTIDVLEAAHISPHKGPHTNGIKNGILLRADIHVLFDLRLLTITPDLEVRVHPRLEDEYASFNRKPLAIIPEPKSRPHSQLLLAHNARCKWLIKQTATAAK
ncbi:HNH endonuclease [Humibacillus sp. DSM 29435]|uniref:HNH endonuclease n=1 Tax=Humibacillus sp. DSM 29435 TaxID=1869167 RepID=UPI0009F5045C|nr:HNH endonuclease [Humibacillus sp. DSM 29435]